MSFSIIACIGKNHELGKDGKLIWHLPSDMRFFKQITSGHKIVMGRKTWDSLPGKLPNREHFIISKNLSVKNDDINIISDIDNFIDKYKNSTEEIFVIGGESIYFAFLPYADVLYLTVVDAEEPNADVFFPTFDQGDWRATQLQSVHENGLDYSINKYERR